MKKLVFATNNKHKIKEISNLIHSNIQLFSLHDIGFSEDIPEDFPTIDENASQKAFFIYNKYHINCFADDTGLEVESLNGEPGVFSARYAANYHNDPSIEGDAEQNIKLLLNKLENKNNRNARFRTVISFINNGEEKLFEGIVNGIIIHKKRGEAGFGYDPVFIPEGYDKTFAEMELSLKNKISHRSIAFKKFIEHLNKL